MAVFGVALVAFAPALSCSPAPPPGATPPVSKQPAGFTGERIATGGSASRMLLARVTLDGGVQARLLGAGWSDWRDLGSPQVTSGLAITQSGDFTTIFARGTNGLEAITHDASANAWGGWYDLRAPSGSAIASAPTAVEWPAKGDTAVFVRGTDDALWGTIFDPKALPQWSAWVSLGGAIASAPFAWTSGGDLHVVAAGPGGTFAARTFGANSGWGPWEIAASPSAIVSSPVVATDGARAYAVARGKDDSVQIATFSGGAWVGGDLGGRITGTPAIVSSGGVVEVFARDLDSGKLASIARDESGWGEWSTAPGWSNFTLAESPVAFDAGGALRVYGADEIGALSETARRDTWSDFVSVSPSSTDFAPGTITDPLPNPGMGWMVEEMAYFTGHAGDATDGTKPDEEFYPANVCRDFEWNLVDTVELIETWSWIQRGGPASFDWTRLDNMVKYWVGRGKRISLRVTTDDIGCYEPMFRGGGPGSRMPDRNGCAGPPSWMWDEVQKFTYDDEDATWEFPDYADPKFIAAYSAFVHEYAEHYKNNPNVDLVDLHAYGQWGEWHSSEDEFATDPPFQFGADDDVRKQTLGKLVDVWAAEFSNKILPLSASYEYRSPTKRWNIGTLRAADPTSIPSPFDYYKSISAFDVAFAKPNVTVRRDGYDGLPETTIFAQFDGRVLQTEGFGNAAKKLPAVAEFKTNYFGATHDDDGNPRDRVDAMLQQVLDYHNNYAMLIGWGCNVGPIGFDAKDFVQQDSKRMLSMLQAGGLGYRFEMTSATFPHQIDAAATDLTITTSWRNTAVGRAITNYAFAFYLVRTSDHSVVAWTKQKPQTEDVRDWVGGAVHTVAATFGASSGFTKPAPGEYRIMVALVDPATGVPKVNLAMPKSEGKVAPLGVIYVR